MNDQLFAEELKEVLEQELTPYLGREAVPAIEDTPEVIGYPFKFAVGQAVETADRPILIISGEYKTYPNGYRMGKLHLKLSSHFGDEDATPPIPSQFTHQSRFTTIFNFVCGDLGAEASTKERLRFLVTSRGKVEMFDYGPTSDEAVDSSFDGQDLVTTLNLDVAWRHLHVV